jgi:mannose-6-phosphate isomerase-like protein (cupin superfamily)
MHSINEFEAFIGQEFVYRHNLISVIQNGGHIHVHNHAELLKRYNGCAIKLEGLERYSRELAIKCAGLKILYDHPGPVTCHAYRSFPGSESFGQHRDPMPVFLDVIEGTKNMIVAGEWQTLQAGQTLYIAANTPHEAINQDDSLMLSFGLESYMIDSQ